MSLLINSLQAIQQNPTLEVMTKEVAGINLPKVAFTRSGDERFDVFVNEFGNTVGFFGGGIILDKAIDWLFQKTAQYKPFDKLAKATQTQVAGQFKHRTAGLGKSFAIYSILAAFMWAMPFVRNLITAERTGTADYTKVIGERQSAQETPEQFKKKVSHYRNTAAAIMGIGAAGTLLSLGLSIFAMKRFPEGIERTLPKFLKEGLKRFNKPNGVFDSLILKGQNFGKGFKDWPALLFWGFPAYAGWIHASRDKYEAKEQILKFTNFVFCFFVVPKIVKRLVPVTLNQAKNHLGTTLTQSVEKVLKPAVEKGKAIVLNESTIAPLKEHLSADEFKKVADWTNQRGRTQFLASLSASVLALGTFPTLLNIWLTRQRLKRDGGPQTPPQHLATTPPYTQPRYSGVHLGPGSTLHYPSFEEWVGALYHRGAQ